MINQCKFLTLSFSGAGHLLPYHLGVIASIRNDEKLISKPISAVSGSSSGAIAATLFVYFPTDQIKEFADRFISDGGRAMYHLKDMIYDTNIYTNDIEHDTSLHIAATRCSDGALQLFDFPSNLSSISDKDHLVSCLQASCKIPPHFHPADVLNSSSSITYPEEDGTMIDGQTYVDGGIAAPAPPTPLDAMECACRVVISPISGDSNENTIRISPNDTSLKFPINIKCKGGFTVYPSIQNFQAMQISAGLLASSSLLQEWYERGVEDGARILTR